MNLRIRNLGNLESGGGAVWWEGFGLENLEYRGEVNQESGESGIRGRCSLVGRIRFGKSGISGREPPLLLLPEQLLRFVLVRRYDLPGLAVP